MFETKTTFFAFALSALLYSAPGVACSPPSRPVEIQIADVATPTAVGFLVSGDVFEEPVATLTGASGDITGAIARTDDVYELFVFRPTAPLEAGEYNLTVTAGPGTETMATVVVGDPGTGVEVALTPGILESSTGSVCCSTGEPENSCIGSCVDTCNSCWPAGYTYSRTVGVDVTFEGAATVAVELSPDDGSDRARPLTVGSVTGVAAAELRFGDPDAAETCVDITVTDLDGVQIASEQHCLAAADFPAIEAREPDEPEAVALCASAPDDTNDPNWQRYGLGGTGENNTTGGTNNTTGGTNNTTGGTNATGTKDSSGGGCSSAGTGASSPIALLVLALFGLRRRTSSRLARPRPRARTAV